MLAVTARASSRRASELIGIIDDSVALAFDMECAEVLYQMEIEREAKLLEAMVGGAALNQLSPELKIEQSRPRLVRQ